MKTILDTLRIGLIVTLALAATLSDSVADEASDAAMEKGQRDVARFVAGDIDALRAIFDATLKSTLSVEMLQSFHEQILEQLGAEKSILNETVTTTLGTQVYVRVALYEQHDGPIETILSYDGEGNISGFVIRPQQVEAATDFLDYKTRTALRLPFEDEWQVFWGGRSLAENYHTAYPDQRFAYDILIFRNGVTHDGDGKSNEQYYCFGRPVLAPGAGVVVSAARDVEDNVPGEMNPAQALGNHVIIDHGNGEFSFLAHIQKGTLAVKVGETVTAGQHLGLTGNSGNTSEAHIHYHLQTTAKFGDGKGLPAQFLNYLADGKSVNRGEPTKGQTIQQAAK